MDLYNMINKFKEPIYITTPLLPDQQALQKSIQSIWDAKWLTNHGQYHNLLEKNLTLKLNVKNLSVVNNGTIGLMIALRALGIRTGEVITTPFTFAATPHAISWNNLDLIFCDINPDTYCIDADKIEQHITKKTKAILAVHVFGNLCDVEKIQAIAKKHQLKVIYDAAHAFNATINGNPIGNYGDISCFSFHATKLFHSLEGGCLTYNDSALKDTIYLLRNFGIQDEDSVVDIGLNGKMNEIQSAVGLLVLDMVNEERRKRSIVYNTYHDHLHDIEGLILPSMPAHCSNSYQYFPIRILDSLGPRSRDYLFNTLKSYNVISRKYFYPLCSDYTPYQHLPTSSRDNLPIANIIKDQILCLPFYGDLGVDSTKKICAIIREIMAKQKTLLSQ